MALPLIAAGIAARAIATKLATRAVGGIVGAGAKTVAPVYRNMPKSNVKIVPNIAAEAKEFSKFQGQPMSAKQYQQIQNKGATASLKFVKSGNVAKVKAKKIEGDNLLKSKKPTIKVNSNPMRGK
jgi:phosphoribulokinase